MFAYTHENDRCPQCQVAFDNSMHQKWTETCGHSKCRTCAVFSEVQCSQCFRSKSQSGGNQEPLSLKKFPAVQILEVLEDDEANQDVNCVVNNKSFTMPNHDHITVFPGVPEKYQCNICSKTFTTKSHYTYHQYCLTGEKPFKCSTCGKGFITAAHFKYHLLGHTGETPHSCPTCGKGFRQKVELTRHMLIHSGGAYKCDTCHEQFPDVKSFKSHEFLHTGIPPYKCSVCDVGFMTQKQLMAHTSTHPKGLVCPFLCTICDKRLLTKKTLSAHLKRHATRDRHVANVHKQRKLTPIKSKPCTSTSEESSSESSVKRVTDAFSPSSTTEADEFHVMQNNQMLIDINEAPWMSTSVNKQAEIFAPLNPSLSSSALLQESPYFIYGDNSLTSPMAPVSSMYYVELEEIPLEFLTQTMEKDGELQYELQNLCMNTTVTSNYRTVN